MILGCAMSPPRPVTIRHQPALQSARPNAAGEQNRNGAGTDKAQTRKQKEPVDGNAVALVELLKKNKVISADEADNFIVQYGAGNEPKKDIAASERYAALLDLLKKKKVISADEATPLAGSSPAQAEEKKVAGVAAQAGNKENDARAVTNVTALKKDSSEPVGNKPQEEKQQAAEKNDKMSSEKIAPAAAAEIKKEPVAAGKIIVVGNSDTKRYHLPGMPNYDKVQQYHRVLFESEQEAIDNGYYKAGTSRKPGVSRKTKKESPKKPEDVPEVKKDLPEQVSTQTQLIALPATTAAEDAVSVTTTKNVTDKMKPEPAGKAKIAEAEMKLPATAKVDDPAFKDGAADRLKSGLDDRIKTLVREEVARAIAQRDKQHVEEITASVTQGLTKTLPDQIRSQVQEEVPKVTANSNREQKEQIISSVNEELKKNIQEQVKTQVKQEVPEEVKKIDLTASLPEWVKRIRFSGDIRLRYEYVNYDKQNYNGFTQISQGTDSDVLQNTWASTDGFKYRFLLGIESINPYFDAAVRLSTGNTTNPVSTNTVFGDYFNKDTVVFDQAYVKIKPWDFLSIYGGRMPNPWFSTDLVWDTDLNFEGLALALKKQFGRQTPFLTIGAFPLQQSGPTSTLDFSQHNKWLYAAQTGLEIKNDKGISAHVGAAYYLFKNITGVSNETLIAGATDWSSPLYNQRGNTLFYIDPLFSKKFGLASEFKEMNITGFLDIGFWDPVHIILSGDYVRNLGFKVADVAARTGLDTPEQWVDGYRIGFSVGHPKVRGFGQWKTSLIYKFVGRDAVVDAFTDSDFNLGTNAKGWIVAAEFGLVRNMWLCTRWVSTNEISGPPLAMDLFQIDLNVRF